ncbi:hypothetical protein [Shewanella algae]|uniref:hypothetical protein n=1 Tax=Shewanella algae TaxID=38313 RepID=UPI0034D3BD10
MSKMNKFGFTFFLSIYITLINEIRPTNGWTYLPELADALTPAVCALLAHITVLIIAIMRLPSEEQVKTWVTVFYQKWEIKRQLKDPMLDVEYKDKLHKRYHQLSEVRLDAFAEVETAKSEDTNKQDD